MDGTEPSHLFSPGPAHVHLDDVGVSAFGPQEPGLAAVLRLAPAAGSTVAVEEVAMETPRAADLVQFVILSVTWEVKGPQCCLLQDTGGSTHTRNIQDYDPEVETLLTTEIKSVTFIKRAKTKLMTDVLKPNCGRRG